jgi:hypothetical protein
VTGVRTELRYDRWALPLTVPPGLGPKKSELRGVHYMGGRWLVNGSSKGLVALTIEPPAQAKVWRKTVTVRELWVSVTDPGVLVAACTAKAK